MEMETGMATETETVRHTMHKELAIKKMKNDIRHLAGLLLILGAASATVLGQQRTYSGPQNIPQMMTSPTGSGFGSGAAGPIGAGDLLEMSVFDTPELSGKMRVSNTGDILVPLVGSLHVAGMKAEEAQNLIRQKFIDGGFLKDPQVSVFVAEYATQGVSVLGEVKNPGIYPAFGSHHLLDYISQAQGLTPLAGTAVTITHETQGAPQRVKLQAGTTPKPENNPVIQPGDTIYVERTGVVYVVGDVAHPGGFPMDHDDQLTILQAIALAQGTNSTAARSSARLIRTSAQGRQEIPVNLKKILTSKATDLELQDNDILFVPSSTAKLTLRDFENALPAASAASIYRVP
jgi:polysaccharide export outer membrane protein